MVKNNYKVHLLLGKLKHMAKDFATLQVLRTTTYHGGTSQPLTLEVQGRRSRGTMVEKNSSKLGQNSETVYCMFPHCYFFLRTIWCKVWCKDRLFDNLNKLSKVRAS